MSQLMSVKPIKIIQLVTAIITIIAGALYLVSISADWNPVFESAVKFTALISALLNSAILMVVTYSTGGKK